MYKLRNTTKSDSDIIFEIKRNALGKYIEETWGWDEQLQRNFHNEEIKTEPIRIIEIDNKPIGTVSIINKDDEIRICRLYIINSFQSKGIGTGIINDVISEYGKNKKIRLGVLKVNSRARILYEKLGFEICGEENSHYQMIYEKPIICKNCGIKFKGNFCNNCGLKSDIHRITLKHIFHEFFHGFVHLDKGILFLIKEMCIRPGVVARDYIEGKRNKYFNPFQFLILGVAAITFVTIKLDLGFGAASNIHVTSDSAEELSRVTGSFTKYFYNYFNILQFLSIPLLSIFSYVFFRKSGYNYAENLVLNTFLFGQRCLVYLLFTPLFYIFRHDSDNIARYYMLVWQVYFIWGYIQFFRPGKKFFGVIKAALAIGCFFIINSGILVFILVRFFE